MMSEPWEYEQEEAEEEYREKLYEELGPQWAEEHSLFSFEDAVKDFTAERLQSYYVANPHLAGPANDSLLYAESLMPSHPRSALVFATTAIELSIKSVFLKPIVFGLVHTEGLAGFITDLTTQHTGMERFQNLLTEILFRFGGVDLKTFTRSGSTKTLWTEIGEVQKVRNLVLHRGEKTADGTALLALAIASTLLKEIFPLVLSKLDLHLHDPGVVCNKKHTVGLMVYFPNPGNGPSISATVELNLEQVDFDNMPETIRGMVVAGCSGYDLLVMQSVPSVPMWITSTLVKYIVRFVPGSVEFTGTRASNEAMGR